MQLFTRNNSQEGGAFLGGNHILELLRNQQQAILRAFHTALPLALGMKRIKLALDSIAVSLVPIPEISKLQ